MNTAIDPKESTRRSAEGPGVAVAPPRVATLQISEIYRSIQGESTHAGRPCAFVRLTGCPLRCVWCDTAFAFAGGECIELPAILERVAALGVRLVEVTGGEPLAQPACLKLLTALCDAGHEVLLETSGALDIAPVDPRVVKILDIKCPGSGESARNRWENLKHLGARDEIKLVIADRADYEWARRIVGEFALADARPTHFSPVWGRLDPAELADWILEDGLSARPHLQLHKLLWPNRRREV
jgi:7-carboxy-7-deazaguanine synthase